VPERHEEDEQEEPRPLRSYEIDANTVRVNNPNPDEPDTIVRRLALASGEVRSYKARKRPED
jgi:hypothetical protein